jgi:ABC-2 type transport system permease protein
VFGAASFSMMGLFLGSVIEGPQIGLLFGIVVAPMIMFGCAYYPWRGLDAVPVMKYAVLINPLTYVSEGMRGVLIPDRPHMPMPMVLAALAAITLLFWRLGLRAFMKRAVN